MIIYFSDYSNTQKEGGKISSCQQMPVLLCPFVFQLAPTVLNSSQQVWEGPVLWEPNLRKHNLQRLLRFYPFVLHKHCTLILAFTHWHTDEKKEARNRPEHFNLPVSDIPGKMQRVGVTFSCLKPQSQVFFNHIKLNFFFFFFYHFNGLWRYSPPSLIWKQYTMAE